ncbi:MAG: hypothetical protein ACOC22_03845 [bacterium]
MASNNKNNEYGRAFDLLVQNVETLADTVERLHNRVSRIEGGLIILKFFLGAGGVIALVLKLFESGAFN